MQVAFYLGRKRFFNRLVSWWLRGPFSHCELVLGYRENGEALCASSSFSDGGVRVKSIALNPDNWLLVDIPDAPEAWNWIQRHDSQGYDLLGLLGFVWRRQRGQNHKWFCSEAVAAMLGYTEPWRFDPMNLYSAVSYAAKVSRAKP